MDELMKLIKRVNVACENVRITIESHHLFFLIFIFLMSTSLINLTQNGYAQTNLQELQNHVADLEKQLVKAEARQEKAYNVQIQLKEQEQKLAKLADSEKYKIQIIEIRADIETIRIKIEAILKKKNDLKENLRLAKNILRKAQKTIKEQQVNKNTVAKPESSIDHQSSSTSQQIVARIEHVDDAKTTYWKIQNININDQLYKEEYSEIKKNFKTNIPINQKDILQSSYYVYQKTGAILNFLIKLNSNKDSADLNISLNQRESRNSNYSSVTAFNFYQKIKSLEEFKKDHFKISIVND